MLFRDKMGKIININKLDYLTDEMYVSQILEIFDNKIKSEENYEQPISVVVNKFLKENNIPNIDD
tara:strand:- start:421 stop:615 length:195 start_codon:yes stop_codon:yes gene_type:complete